MTLRPLLLMATIMLAIAPLSAHATGCQEWNRMSDPSRWDRIDRMIEDAIAGQRGRSYQINRNALARCLGDNSENMFWDFSDICADSNTAQMSAIRSRFKNYIWTCVGS
jgi:hypothetical protein